MKLTKSTLVECSLFSVALIWALNFSVVKTSLTELSPFSFNGIRFVFAAAFVWVVLYMRNEHRFSIQKGDWLKLLGMAALGNLVYQGLFIIGIDLTFSANTAVMLGTIPIWVALFSHFFDLERMNRYKASGVVLAFVGIAFIISGAPQGFSISSQTFLGDAIIVLAAIVWGGYTILSKPFLERYTPLQFSAIVTGLGAVMLFAAGLPAMAATKWTTISWAAYGGVLYSGLLSIGAAYVIWNYGLKTVGAVHTATYQNLVPVLGLVFGVVLLGEDLTLLQYLGSALVIGGIVLSRRKKTSQVTTPSPRKN